MIYFFNKINFYIHYISSFTFLEKVSKKRHPSRIAPLSRSFGMTFFLINTWAIANQKLSKVINNLLLVNTLFHLRFFILCMPQRFFGYFPFFSVAVQKEKSARKKCPLDKQRNSNNQQNIGIKK